MRRILPVLALAALTLACTPQNALNSLPTAPGASAAPSAAPGNNTGVPVTTAGLKPLAVGVKMTYEHKVSSTGSTTVDTYAVTGVNDTSVLTSVDRLFNGKEDIKSQTKTLSRQNGVVWPDFSRLAAGEFSSGYTAALASAVEESVTVPAGTFKAQKLFMDGSRKRTYWISGTYLLKATTESPTENTTTELTKVE